MRGPFLQLGAVLALLVAITIGVFEGREVTARLGMSQQAAPVLVFAVSKAKNLARLRSVVEPDRIVGESDAGMALAGGRLYVTDVSAAGPLINEAGWVERPIEIVTLGEDGEGEGGDGSGSGASPEERLARLRSLVNKPTLTRGEQIFVLQAMNDGIEI